MMDQFGFGIPTSNSWTRTFCTIWHWAAAAMIWWRCLAMSSLSAWAAPRSAWRTLHTSSWTRSATSCPPEPSCRTSARSPTGTRCTRSAPCCPSATAWACPRSVFCCTR
uniref:(northern house mosquito) hypothetical protein n=1 Tax=Culex pipiens TaxID=7175 RepID=A0A8D8NMT7_CULPI